MSIILLLIVVSIVVAIGFLAAFIWAVKNGQYDDDYSPSRRILFDDMEKDDKEDQKESKLTSNKQDSTKSLT